MTAITAHPRSKRFVVRVPLGAFAAASRPPDPSAPRRITAPMINTRTDAKALVSAT